VKDRGADHAKALGERLRRIRTQKGLSLQEVQEESRGRWKAAVVGAYERGDRNVTVPRLVDLARFYGVPLSELLPSDSPAEKKDEVPARLVFNLERIEGLPEAQRSPITRFATAIQIKRGDYNGRVLTVRGDDLMALALLYQTSADDLQKRLGEWGLLARG
jgi:transcriptional regulator with XRE-family HTH domain